MWLLAEVKAVQLLQCVYTFVGICASIGKRRKKSERLHEDIVTR